MSFNRFCSIGHRGASERKGDIPRPGRGRPRRRRDVRLRGGLLAAAEVADAAPATALRPEGPCCAAAPLPRLSAGSSSCGAREAAPHVLATQEFVANGGGRPSGRHRQSAASPGRTGCRGRVGQRGWWCSEAAASASPTDRLESATCRTPRGQRRNAGEMGSLPSPPVASDGSPAIPSVGATDDHAALRV